MYVQCTNTIGDRGVGFNPYMYMYDIQYSLLRPPIMPLFYRRGRQLLQRVRLFPDATPLLLSSGPASCALSCPTRRPAAAQNAPRWLASAVAEAEPG